MRLEISVAFLLLLAVLVTAGVPPSKKNNQLGITNGVEADIHEIPYQVLLLTQMNQHTLVPHCGGSIISPRFILSAAHCFNTKFPLVVRVGSTDAMQGGVVHSIEAHFIHPKYKQERHFDYALAQLQTPLVYNDVVRPVTLPTPQYQVPVGDKLAISGWGLAEEDAIRMEIHLKKAVVLNVAPETCVEYYRKIEVDVAASHIVCAGGGEDEVDTCNGDSGGPMVHQNTLVGVVSFGEGCGRPGVPGVYSRVAQVVEWIKEMVQGALGDKELKELRFVKQ